jgi:hypothetical protein
MIYQADASASSYLLLQAGRQAGRQAGGRAGRLIPWHEKRTRDTRVERQGTNAPERIGRSREKRDQSIRPLVGAASRSVILCPWRGVSSDPDVSRSSRSPIAISSCAIVSRGLVDRANGVSQIFIAIAVAGRRSRGSTELRIWGMCARISRTCTIARISPRVLTPVIGGADNRSAR